MPPPDHTQPWDWSTPFDEAFIASAPVREDSAAARADRARRIDRGHQQRQPWRSPAARPRPAWGRDRAARGGSPLLTAVTLAVVALVLVLSRSSWSSLAGLDPAAGMGGPAIPRPPDARDSRILPPVTAPPGDGGYQLLSQGGSARFDPCRPVHWAMRPDGAPVDAVPLLTGAFAALSRATGLSFVYDGPTPEAPAQDRKPVQELYGRRAAPVLVAWSDAAASPRLAGRVAGYAGPISYDPDGRGLRYVTGQVVLDAPDFRSIAQPGRSSVVLHELGHLVGLDHVRDPGDTMYPSGNRSAGYSVGALRGLAQLGDGRCFS